MATARPTWTGSIGFGLVNVPVKLYSATESHTVHFHLLDRESGDRIRNRRVAESSGEEVDSDDIVKGYEVTDGQYVVVEPGELDAIAPERSRMIEIDDFVALGDIDPIYFQRTYFVVPDDESAAKPYELLRAAMNDAGRAGIARFVMRGKEYLAAVRPTQDGLVLETMYFADEVRDQASVTDAEESIDETELSERELRTASQLVESLSADWDPSRYADTYRQDVLELVERKAEGKEIVVEEPSKAAPVTDLMAALEASVNRARSGRLRERSVDELYAEAQRRDIEGRSKMSKDELIDAIQQAS